VTGHFVASAAYRRPGTAPRTRPGPVAVPIGVMDASLAVIVAGAEEIVA
jgi:hypothetical protein